jgi:hypothetical protein
VGVESSSTFVVCCTGPEEMKLGNQTTSTEGKASRFRSLRAPATTEIALTGITAKAIGITTCGSVKCHDLRVGMIVET